MPKKVSLEEEAKQFVAKKKPAPKTRGKTTTLPKNKTLTLREYYVGQALTALLVLNQGQRNLNKEQIIEEAFEWADKLLEQS